MRLLWVVGIHGRWLRATYFPPAEKTHRSGPRQGRVIQEKMFLFKPQRDPSLTLSISIYDPATSHPQERLMLSAFQSDSWSTRRLHNSKSRNSTKRKPILTTRATIHVGSSELADHIAEIFSPDSDSYRGFLIHPPTVVLMLQIVAFDEQQRDQEPTDQASQNA